MEWQNFNRIYKSTQNPFNFKVQNTLAKTGEDSPNQKA